MFYDRGESRDRNQLSIVDSETLELIQREYRTGKDAFERGRYRESVEALQKASALVSRNTSLGGEVQIWLVTAYEAAGMRSEARNLCKQLEQHPNLDIRQQGKRLLYILEAPQLERRPEWLTEIPDLGAMTQSDPQYRRGAGVKSTQPKTSQTSELEDLGSMNLQDNPFIWVALIATILTVGGLIWLS